MNITVDVLVGILVIALTICGFLLYSSNNRVRDLKEKLAAGSKALRDRDNAMTPEEIMQFLETVGCPPLMRELVHLKLSKTPVDTVNCLSRIASALPDEYHIDSCVRDILDWLRNNLTALLIASQTSKEYKEVLERILECYGRLIPLLNDTQSRREIFTETRTLIQQPKTRRQALLSVLVPLIISEIKNEDLLKAYQKVLQCDLANSDELDAFLAALQNINQFEALDGYWLILFLQTGFATLVTSWNAGRKVYIDQFKSVLGRNLKKKDLDQLLEMINNHIGRDGPVVHPLPPTHILAAPRNQEYMDIALMVSSIHQAQQIPHPLRGRDRHVVPTNQELQAKLTVGQVFVSGQIENFAVGEGYKPGDLVGCGGAWFVASGTVNSAISARESPGIITLIDAVLEGGLEIECIAKPEWDSRFNRWGFRVKWPSVSKDGVKVTKLKLLAKKYPVTR